MNTQKQELALAIIRLSLGVILIAHGLLKWLVFTLAGSAQFFASIGFPGWLAYPVTFGEIIGGALLLLGLFVRPVAIAMLPILLGALWTHVGNGWVFSNPNGGWEYPALLVIMAVVVLLAGPDRWSLALRK
jgi:putative oxidoreductase